MKAAVLDGPGGPEAFRIVDIPIPECGPGDVLVRVMSCGVSFRDVVERNGTYRRDVSYPLIIGLEISGVVQATGALVGSVSPGDHVCSKAFSSCGFCRYCRTGRETTCLQRRPVRGGYAEFVSLPEDAWVRVAAELPFELTCSLGPAVGVALNAVRDSARVLLGESVLVTGATGGVGWPSVQLAKQAGARVIAVTREASKAWALADAGADDVVVMDEHGRFADQVKALTGGQGVDVVIDNVGSRVFNEAFDSLSLHGRYALVGQLFGESTEVNLARIFFKRAHLLGVGSVSRAQLTDVIALAAAGRIVPRVAQVMPLDQVSQAHALVEGGLVIGRVVLTPSTPQQ
jgi:NADPH:quinone reductase-like Zn-dependent oxidoreductase